MNVEHIGDRLSLAKRTGNWIDYYNDGRSAYRHAKSWYQARIQWTVTVESKDRLYEAVLRWFLQSDVADAPPRAVKAVFNNSRRITSFSDDYDLGLPGGRRPGTEIEVYYDEKGQRDLTIGGHQVTVSLRKPESSSMSEPGVSSRTVEPDRIYFYAKSRDGQQAVLTLLRTIAVDQSSRKPALHLMTPYGDWQRRDDLPERSLSSVILKEGQMERLRDDLQRFMDDEAEYVRRGMPYHRGYLLSGVAGTGKTSIVRALAAHFQMDLWYAPLGDLTKDSSLTSLINQVHPGSILLLEDIDRFHAATSRDHDGGGLSTAGLLNALDGVATPHGLITFITTNEDTAIDDAVIRPGRVDVREDIGLPDQDQIARLYNSWYGVILPSDLVGTITFTGTTAAATEVFKRNLNDSAAALTALQNDERPAEDTVTRHGGGYDREGTGNPRHTYRPGTIRRHTVDSNC